MRRIGRLIGFVAAVLLGLAALGQPVLADVLAHQNECCSVAPSGTGSGFANLGDEISDGARMVDQPLRPPGYNQAITPEKLDHIFVPKHNLDPLVTNLGSREAVIEQMLIGIRGQTPASGVFEIPTVIGGQTVVVRGAVVDGVPRLGTAFTP